MWTMFIIELTSGSHMGGARFIVLYVHIWQTRFIPNIQILIPKDGTQSVFCHIFWNCQPSVILTGTHKAYSTPTCSYYVITKPEMHYKRDDLSPAMHFYKLIISHLLYILILLCFRKQFLCPLVIRTNKFTNALKEICRKKCDTYSLV